MRDNNLLRKNVNRITNEEKRVVNDLLCRINKMNVELSNHCVERENCGSNESSVICYDC